MQITSLLLPSTLRPRWVVATFDALCSTPGMSLVEGGGSFDVKTQASLPFKVDGILPLTIDRLAAFVLFLSCLIHHRFFTNSTATHEQVSDDTDPRETGILAVFCKETDAWSKIKTVRFKINV